MLSLISKYKSVLAFILTFLGVYLVLSFAYAYYLEREVSTEFYPDYFTHQVAVQSEWLVENLGYQSKIEPHPDEPSMKLFVENAFVARIVEGCNAISVLILYSAFILAFYQGIKKTLVFLAFGWLVLYIINIVRIALMSIGLYEVPQYSRILHDIFFPGIIYGSVVLLWLFWIQKFKKSRS